MKDCQLQSVIFNFVSYRDVENRVEWYSSRDRL